MELHSLPLTEMSRLIKSRDISASELVESHLQRIDAVEGTLGVVASEVGVQAFVVTNSTNGYTIKTQWEDNASSGYDAAQVDDVTLPGVGAFPTTSASAPDLRAPTADIQPSISTAEGEKARLWIERSVSATAKFVEGEKIIIRVKGEYASNG